jgi:hypothetical protein
LAVLCGKGKKEMCASVILLFDSLLVDSLAVCCCSPPAIAPRSMATSPRRNSSSFQSAAVSRYDRTLRFGVALVLLFVFFFAFAK